METCLSQCLLFPSCYFCFFQCQVFSNESQKPLSEVVSCEQGEGFHFPLAFLPALLSHGLLEVYGQGSCLLLFSPLNLREFKGNQSRSPCYTYFPGHQFVTEDITTTNQHSDEETPGRRSGARSFSPCGVWGWAQGRGEATQILLWGSRRLHCTGVTDTLTGHG